MLCVLFAQGVRGREPCERGALPDPARRARRPEPERLLRRAAERIRARLRGGGARPPLLKLEPALLVLAQLERATRRVLSKPIVLRHARLFPRGAFQRDASENAERRPATHVLGGGGADERVPHQSPEPVLRRVQAAHAPVRDQARGVRRARLHGPRRHAVGVRAGREEPAARRAGARQPRVRARVLGGATSYPRGVRGGVFAVGRKRRSLDRGVSLLAAIDAAGRDEPTVRVDRAVVPNRRGAREVPGAVAPARVVRRLGKENRARGFVKLADDALAGVELAVPRAHRAHVLGARPLSLYERPQVHRVSQALTDVHRLQRLEVPSELALLRERALLGLAVKHPRERLIRAVGVPRARHAAVLRRLAAHVLRQSDVRGHGVERRTRAARLRLGAHLALVALQRGLGGRSRRGAVVVGTPDRGARPRGELARRAHDRRPARRAGRARRLGVPLVPPPGGASRGARPRARGHVVRMLGPIHGLRGERVRERVERALRLERHDRRIARTGAFAKRQPRGGARHACRRHSPARPDLETTMIETSSMSPKRAADVLGRGQRMSSKHTSNTVVPLRRHSPSSPSPRRRDPFARTPPVETRVRRRRASRRPPSAA